MMNKQNQVSDQDTLRQALTVVYLHDHAVGLLSEKSIAIEVSDSFGSVTSLLLEMSIWRSRDTGKCDENADV